MKKSLILGLLFLCAGVFTACDKEDSKDTEPQPYLAYDAIEEQYESVENFLTARIGVDLAKMRELYTE